MRTIYLASPADRHDGDHGFRETIRGLLLGRGFIVYDAVIAWKTPPQVLEGSQALPAIIAQTHFAALDVADAVIAILPDAPPSIGVPMEVERALFQQKPVLVFGGRSAHKSPLLNGRAMIYTVDQAAEGLIELARRLDAVPQDLGPPMLKVIGEGQTPTRSYPDDCGFDLYTFCDPMEVRTQEDVNRVGSNFNREIFFKNPDEPCTIGNYESWAYRAHKGDFVDIDCGVSIELPPGVWGLITGRSSAIRKRGLLVVNGIIDTGYRGRLYMPVLNVGNETQIIKHGERIGQLILMRNVSLGINPIRVDFLNESDRGTKGFGSSGT